MLKRRKMGSKLVAVTVIEAVLAVLLAVSIALTIVRWVGLGNIISYVDVWNGTISTSTDPLFFVFSLLVGTTVTSLFTFETLDDIRNIKVLSKSKKILQSRQETVDKMPVEWYN